VQFKRMILINWTSEDFHQFTFHHNSLREE
jgi:hypothetical protein